MKTRFLQHSGIFLILLAIVAAFSFDPSSDAQLLPLPTPVIPSESSDVESPRSRLAVATPYNEAPSGFRGIEPVTTGAEEVGCINLLEDPEIYCIEDHIDTGVPLGSHMRSEEIVYTYDFDNTPTPSNITAEIIDHNEDDCLADGRPGIEYSVRDRFVYYYAGNSFVYPLSTNTALGGVSHNPTIEVCPYTWQLEVLLDLQSPVRFNALSLTKLRYRLTDYPPTSHNVRLKVILDADDVPENGTLFELTLCDILFSANCPTTPSFDPVYGVRYVRFLFETDREVTASHFYYISLDNFQFWVEPIDVDCSDDTIDVAFYETNFLTQEAQDMRAIATNDGLIMHQGPTLNARHVGTIIPWRESVTVLSRMTFTQTAPPDQVWYYVQYGGQSGWVAARMEDKHYIAGVETNSDPCSDKPEPAQLTFTYDRGAAARYAITHSYNNNTTVRASGRVTERINCPLPTGFPCPLPYAHFYYSDLDPSNPEEESTGSGNFVSEVLWMGGMAMTSGADEECSVSTLDNPGWRYCASPKDTASKAWGVHKGIGQHFTTGDFWRPPGGFNNILSIKGYQVEFVGLYKPDKIVPHEDLKGLIVLTDGGTSGNFESQKLGIFAEQHLAQIQVGDYVWIDAVRDLNKDGDYDDVDEGTPHGLIVVGWQEPLRCDEVLSGITNPRFSPETLYPTHVDAANHGLSSSVPYVADYTTAQSPMPRPFYCTRWTQTVNPPPGQGSVLRFHEHNYRFYRMPDVITVPVSALHDNANWHWEE